MYKRCISSILIVALVNLVGCYSYQQITKEEFKQTEKHIDLKVVTKNKQIYKFEEGSYTVKTDSLYGLGKTKLLNSEKHFEDFNGSVNLEEIESFEFDKFNTVLTVLLISAGLGLIVLILTADRQQAGFPL